MSQLVKLDFGAEVRPLKNYRPINERFYEVECPFCGTNNLVYTRDFLAGVRCDLPECQAMLCQPPDAATKDLLPKSETVVIHGLRGRAGSLPESGLASLCKEGGAA